MSDETDKAVQEAEDALYSHLDAYGGTKRAQHLISALIDAKLAHAIDEIRNPPLPGESNARFIAGPHKETR
jgi:hypothetical protein